MTDQNDDFLGDLRFARIITSVGQAAAGGLVIFPGLYFLLAGRTAMEVGVQSITAILMMVGLLGLTLLNIVELLGGSAERGGTYSFIHESFGGWGGFIAGWIIMGANLVLGAALLVAAGTQVSQYFPDLNLPGWLIGLGLLVILILLQLFRFLPRQERIYFAVLALLLLVLGVLLSVIPGIESARLEWNAARGSPDLRNSAAWLLLAYAGLEAILASRRQIQNSAQRMPLALGIALAGGAVLLLAGTLAAVGLTGLKFPGDTSQLITAFAEGSFLPEWLLALIAILALMAAANTCLMTAARQMNALSKRRALPIGLVRVYRPFRLPPLIFAAMFTLMIPLLIWAPVSLLLDWAAIFFLSSMLLLNLAAVRSRSQEPNRRRSFLTPLFPLVPGAALLLGGIILIALPGSGFIGAGVWLILGWLLYVIYGREHQMQAQEGVLVFGSSSLPDKPKGTYRILVPLGRGVERRMSLQLATAVAHQMDGELIPLQVIPIADPLAMEEGQRTARKRNALFEWSMRMAARRDVKTYPITRMARTVEDGILETVEEEDCDLIFLTVALRDENRNVRLGRVIDPVVSRAPCDLVVLAFHPDKMKENRKSVDENEPSENGSKLSIERIVVPTAGGPNAPLATRLAVLLAREYGAAARAVYVARPGASEHDLALGEERIQHTLEAMRSQAAELPAMQSIPDDPDDGIPFESQVITAPGVMEGIVTAGQESDLVLIGASEESVIDQVLFGTLPEQVARLCSAPVLMVRRAQGRQRIWLRRMWDAVSGSLPKLTAEEMVDIYVHMRRSARPDVDYFVMIGLSSVIASYGLLQDSTAVIIGAMLVAPLFTPILALSLSIVQGDIRLFRIAVEATLKGIALAIGISVLITILSPLRAVGSEILARVQPNLFDLAVALASGAAGAYALTRKDVATSLPGVAIAAALVPPLGVVGIGLALGDARISGGGGLLFATNLVAIVFAAAITLLLLGFRPTERGERETRLRQGLVTSLILLLVISIPLAIVFVGSVQESSARSMIERTLTAEIAASGELELLDFTFDPQDEKVEVTARIYAGREIGQDQVSRWGEELSLALDRPVHLRLVSIPVIEFEAGVR
jgi:uncharacterized hydrophobic protein (TIGR00271 family)